MTEPKKPSSSRTRDTWNVTGFYPLVLIVAVTVISLVIANFRVNLWLSEDETTRARIAHSYRCEPCSCKRSNR